MRIDSLVINVQDVRRAARFWAEALGYQLRDGAISDDASPVLVPTDGAGPAITLDDSDRTHLDLRTDSAEEQAAEVERLVGMGARRVEWTYGEHAGHVVLADPEGNLFCVINTGSED
jgi:catechol 2,3-dioxygenase-like lactoylglutathione lyase family enzyme